MRHILALLLFSTFHLAHANDTLTRAAIYNFNVGDTFDYRIADYRFDYYNQNPPSYSLTYSRYTIQNIYYSLDSMKLFIAREQLFPASSFFDTLALDSPRNYEVLLDLSDPQIGGRPQDTVIVDASAVFWGKQTNLSHLWQGYFWYDMLVAQGLGTVQTTMYGGTGVGGAFDDTTTLIYYSGISGTMGTPYTVFTTSMKDIPLAADLVAVYPNPATQSCTIFISNYNGETYTARLIDITGKEISGTMTFASGSFTFPVSQYSGGVYLLQIADKQNHQVTKKLVIE